MNIYTITYNVIRIVSIIAILVVLFIGFIQPISFTQGLVINPILLVTLMSLLAISNEKLKSAKNQLKLFICDMT